MESQVPDVKICERGSFHFLWPPYRQPTQIIDRTLFVTGLQLALASKWKVRLPFQTHDVCTQVQLTWDNFLLTLPRRCATVARYFFLTYSNKLAGNWITVKPSEAYPSRIWLIRLNVQKESMLILVFEMTGNFNFQIIIHFCILETTSGFIIQIINSLM